MNWNVSLWVTKRLNLCRRFWVFSVKKYLKDFKSNDYYGKWDTWDLGCTPNESWQGNWLFDKHYDLFVYDFCNWPENVYKVLFFYKCSWITCSLFILIFCILKKKLLFYFSNNESTIAFAGKLKSFKVC